MALGGKRPGAGRPKGSKNKVNLKREAEIAASGLTPLQFMLDKLRDEKATDEDRKWAAQAAAPYVHPRLNSVDHTGDVTMRHEDWLTKLPENGDEPTDAAEAPSEQETVH